jgi:hypothetical protein
MFERCMAGQEWKESLSAAVHQVEHLKTKYASFGADDVAAAALMEEFLELEKKRSTSVNKRRREIDKRMAEISSGVDTSPARLEIFQQKQQLFLDIQRQEAYVEQLRGYVDDVLYSMQYTLVEAGMISARQEDGGDCGQEMRLTWRGTLATYLGCSGEIKSSVPVLPWIQFLLDGSSSGGGGGGGTDHGTYWFVDFTAAELAVFFSMFADISMPEEERIMCPVRHFENLAVSTPGGVLLLPIHVRRAAKAFDEKIETYLCYSTGAEASSASKLHFDLLEATYLWATECSEESDCKLVLETIIPCSTGDFVKAMIKIVNIATETRHCLESWISAASAAAAASPRVFEFLEKLAAIDALILKHVVTMQSLYTSL